MADMSSMEEIKQKEAELKARKEEQAKIAKEIKEQEKQVKAARKAYEKKVTEIANKEIELESSYIDLEHTIKGTQKYDELVIKIASLEEEIKAERKELGMMNIGYDGQTKGEKEYEYEKVTSSSGIVLPNGGLVRKEVKHEVKSDVKVEAKDEKEPLTDEEKKEIAILLQSCLTLQANEADKDTDPYKYSVQTAAEKSLIVRVFHKYRDRLDIDQNLIDTYMNKQYKTLKDNLDIHKLLSDNGIEVVDIKSLDQDERLKYEQEVEEVSLQGVRVFHSNRLNQLAEEKIQEAQDKKDEIINNAKQELQSSLDYKKLEMLLRNGFDLNYVAEATDLTVLKTGREYIDNEEEDEAKGYILREEKVLDAKEPLFKPKFTAKQKRIMQAYKEQIARKSQEKDGETLTAEETLQSAKKASVKIIEDAEIEIGDQSYIERYSDIITERTNVRVFREILDSQRKAVFKGFDIDVTEYGIELENDTMAGRRKAIKQMSSYIESHEENCKKNDMTEEEFDELAEHSVIKLQQYSKAKNMMKEIEKLDEMQKSIDSITDVSSLETEGAKLQQAGLTRQRVERYSSINQLKEYEGKESISFYDPELEGGILVHKSALDYLHEDGFEEKEILENVPGENEKFSTGFENEDGEIAYAKDYAIVEEDFIGNLLENAKEETNKLEGKIVAVELDANQKHLALDEATMEMQDEFVEAFDVEYVEETSQEAQADGQEIEQ